MKIFTLVAGHRAGAEDIDLVEHVGTARHAARLADQFAGDRAIAVLADVGAGPEQLTFVQLVTTAALSHYALSLLDAVRGTHAIDGTCQRGAIHSLKAMVGDKNPGFCRFKGHRISLNAGGHLGREDARPHRAHCAA